MLKAKCWLGDVQEKDDRNRSKGVHPKCGPVAHERIVSLWISAPFNKVLRLSTVYTAAHNLFCVVDFGLETVTLVGQRHGSALRSKNPAEGSTGSVAKLSDGMSSSRRWGSSCREGCSVGASIGQSLCSKYAFSRFGWTGTLTGRLSSVRSLKWKGGNFSTMRRLRGRYAAVLWTNLCGVLACTPRLDDQRCNGLDGQINRVGLSFWVENVACWRQSAVWLPLG